MLFNSISFGIFIIIVFILYYLVPHKYRWFFLLWQIPATFILPCFTWIFFRANSIQDAVWIISRLFWDIEGPLNYLHTCIICLGVSRIAAVGMLLTVLLLLVVTALFSSKGVETEFIYSQF